MTPPADVIAAAKAAAERWGVPASVLLAQWALESGWGQFEAGCHNHPPVISHNPFGEKALPGQPSVTIPTHEVIGGKQVAIMAPFRTFPSLVAAFASHAEHLATSAHYDEAMRHTDNPDAFANALTGHYATDPLYGQKLRAIMHGSANLVQYDVPPPSPSAPAMQAAA